jgi:hypothetical protein
LKDPHRKVGVFRVFAVYKVAPAPKRVDWYDALSLALRSEGEWTDVSFGLVVRNGATVVIRARRFVIAVATMATLISGALAVSGSAGAAKSYPLCSRWLGTGAIANVSGLQTSLTGTPASSLHYSWWEFRKTGPTLASLGAIPGSACDYIDTDPGSYLPTNTGLVVVGYGETASDWAHLTNFYKPGGLFNGQLTVGRSTPLVLGDGSKAFYNVTDLSANGYAAEPSGTTELYWITALSRNHNVIQIYVMNATLLTTEALVKGVLSKGF